MEGAGAGEILSGQLVEGYDVPSNARPDLAIETHEAHKDISSDSDLPTARRRQLERWRIDGR